MSFHRQFRLPNRAALDSTREPRAFALLELLIVVFIIFVLFTLYFGGGTFRRDQTRQLAACRKNLRNMYAALKAYSIDNNDKFPVVAGAKTSDAPLSLLVPKCTTSTEFFICPGTKDEPLPDAKPFAGRTISYAYYMGRTSTDGPGAALASDRQVHNDPKPIGQWVFSPNGRTAGRNHDKFGGNILFCDGQIQFSPPLSPFNLTNGSNVVLLSPKP